jgi:glyoxylase-like metal-dependent hydrolase (beta-lactamase superfamily II)
MRSYLKREKEAVEMNKGSYRFKLGDFECVSLSDGSHDYKTKKFFANVPEAHIEEVLRQRNLPTDYITTPYAYLFVNTGENRVLVDMGAPRWGTKTGKLLQNMENVGIVPEDIDTVIITHAHPDHVGGTLNEEGQPIYTNAHYYIFKRERDFWFSETATSKAPEYHVTVARKNLEPIQERMQILDQEIDILPGIRVLKAYGHTPGHMVVSVSSGDEQLLYISDTVLYPLHLEYPDWLPVYDVLPDEAEASKHRIFNMAADGKILVLGMHFPPFPSLGHVIKKGKGWQWQPLDLGAEND